MLGKTKIFYFLEIWENGNTQFAHLGKTILPYFLEFVYLAIFYRTAKRRTSLNNNFPVEITFVVFLLILQCAIASRTDVIYRRYPSLDNERLKRQHFVLVSVQILPVCSGNLARRNLDRNYLVKRRVINSSLQRST